MREKILSSVILWVVVGVVRGGTIPDDYPVFGNVSRTFNCPLPVGCPAYTEKYLTNYRYLNPRPNKQCALEDIQAALRKFQEFNIMYGLQVSGECDNATLELFTRKRCGCEDIAKDDEKKMMPSNFYAPQQFNVGNTKWSKTHLKWKVSKYPIVNNHLTDSQVDDAMRRGLDIWAQQTPLTFEKVPGNSPADIDIRFERRRHTQSPPYFDFDGRGSVLAHAFFPESGAVHFDDDEQFVLNSNAGTELFIVAAHEFGHTLGIAHSNTQSALMAPYYAYSPNLQLHPDDIQAVQYLYGAGGTATPTRPPPRPAPTTPPPNMPEYCDMDIQATFKLQDTTYVFRRDSSTSFKTVLYKVTRAGINPDPVPIDQLFRKRSSAPWPRPYPYRVDAAAYIPDRRFLFLFGGTRAYRYSVTSPTGPFVLDEGYPRWMNVEEFPEQPVTAVAMPMSSTKYYMQIFGKTMYWDWDFEKQRVGAWAFPISSFGRNMPTNVNAAFTEDQDTLRFIKGDQFIKFSLRYRRVMEEDADSVQSVKKDFFKGGCA